MPLRLLTKSLCTACRAFSTFLDLPRIGTGQKLSAGDRTETPISKSLVYRVQANLTAGLCCQLGRQTLASYVCWLDLRANNCIHLANDSILESRSVSSIFDARRKTLTR